MKYMGALGWCSEMVALYGLFVLYLCTAETLKRWHTTLKFAAIKVVVFVSSFQGSIVGAVVGGLDESNSCMNKQDMQSFWVTWLVVVETMGLALLMSCAFPADELTQSLGLRGTSLGTVVLDLMHHVESAKSDRLLDTCGSISSRRSSKEVIPTID